MMSFLELPAELRAGILEECFVAGTYLTGKEVYVNEHFRCRRICRETRDALVRYATIRLICQQFREDADEVFFRHYKVTRSIGALAPLESNWRSDVASLVLGKLRHLSLEMLVGNSTMIVLRLELHKQADTWTCQWKNDVYDDLDKDDMASERRMIGFGLPFVESQLFLLGPGEGLCYDDVESIRQIMARQCTVELPSGPDTKSWYFEDRPAKIAAETEHNNATALEPEPAEISKREEAPAPSKVDGIFVEDLVASYRRESLRYAAEDQQRDSFHMLELQGKTYIAPKQSSKRFDQDLALLEDHELIAKYNLQRVRTSVVQKARRTIGWKCKIPAQVFANRIRGVVSRVSRTGAGLQPP